MCAPEVAVMDMHAHPVIEASAHLAGVACGSSDAHEFTQHLATWLRWRLTQWERMPESRYSAAVREMAQAALDAYDASEAAP